MTMWPPDPAMLQRPVYKSLAETLVQAIEAGEMRSGDRLPTHRQLSSHLGVSVQTVSRAYDELIRQGVVIGEVGRGTFVRSGRNEARTPFLPDSASGKFTDFSMVVPVFEPLHANIMREALTRLGTNLPASAISSFRSSRALQKYNPAALKWLKACGLDLPSQRVIMTNGGTSAMTIALMAAASQGDLVVTEELGHHALKPLSRYLGLRIDGLETDNFGVIPSAFARACEKANVRVICLMPTGLSPTATTMPAERREELVKLARRYDVLIVENDAWGPLQTQRPPPVAAMAPERTFYFTSLTKCLMPGLRFGYLIVPETYEQAAANRHLVTNWMATPLMAEIASWWIEDGTAQYLLHWQQQALGKRNRLAAQKLADIDFHASENGMHIWLSLPVSWTEEAFIAEVRSNRIAVAPGSSFEIAETVRKKGVRISLGAEKERILAQGLSSIANIVASNPGTDIQPDVGSD